MELSPVPRIAPAHARRRRREAIRYLTHGVAEFTANLLENFGIEVVRADARDLPVHLLEASDCHQDLCVSMHDKTEHHWFPMNNYPLVEELGWAQLGRHVRMDVHGLPEPTALGLELFAADLKQISNHVDRCAVEHQGQEPLQVGRVEALYKAIDQPRRRRRSAIWRGLSCVQPLAATMQC